MKPLSQYFKKTLFAHKHPTQPIFVYENPLHRWLCFNDEFIQTIINKHVRHRPVLAYLPALCCNLTLATHSSDVVMLGTGGGAIVHYMNKYHPNVELTLVEHNETIIQLAKEFFYINSPIIACNALEYLTYMTPCSHLFVDIFTDNLLPSEIKQRRFLELCSSKSIFASSFNILSKSTLEMKKTLCMIREVFNNQTLCLFVKGKTNVIVHAYKDQHFLPFIQHLVDIKQIQSPKLHPDLGLVSTNHSLNFFSIFIR